ncbi:serine/threonine-protein kinase [Streptomyces diastatochromogenes]|nr:serine/threonine-protein kinase [Streptomyces diastatochromogenes]
MGTVYLARTPGGRTVALKTVHARLATDPTFRSRFRLETDAARIIGARHGAAVVDADPLAETPWLATEYVLGPPLDDAVALGGPLPEPTVRALGAALAGALAQLHSSDVVHRDLKPSNVLVTAYGPKIIDFGIARAAGDDHLTRTGAAAGTPAFMSPEQASGQEHTPAGDVFALAGVLVFAATGHGPFGTGSPPTSSTASATPTPTSPAYPSPSSPPDGLPHQGPVLPPHHPHPGGPSPRRPRRVRRPPPAAPAGRHRPPGDGRLAPRAPPPARAGGRRRGRDRSEHGTLPPPPALRGRRSTDRARGSGGGMWAWLGSRNTRSPTAAPRPPRVRPRSPPRRPPTGRRWRCGRARPSTARRRARN